MKRLFACFVALALFACAEGPTALVGPAVKTNAASTLVATTTITASVSTSDKGTWLTRSGLGVAIASDLSIDRINWYLYNGSGRIQLRRSGSGVFTDHWENGEAGLKLVITTGGTAVSFSPKALGGHWANFALDDEANQTAMNAISTGDTFTLFLGTPGSQEEATDTETPTVGDAGPVLSIVGDSLKVTLGKDVDYLATANYFEFETEHDGRVQNTYRIDGDVVYFTFDPVLSASSYVALDCAAGCFAFEDGTYSDEFDASVGTKPADVYTVGTRTAQPTTPEPAPEPAEVSQVATDGYSLLITFDKVLDDEATVNGSHFMVISGENNDDMVGNQVQSVTVVGNLVQLTVRTEFDCDECQVRYSYTGRGGLTDTDGETVAAFRGSLDNCD